MSKEHLSGGSMLCRQRFKGVENFLRRIAFNLGNTPSQTEVKIISCIPIDVTDLQQKILHLEKQLDGGHSPPASDSLKDSKSLKFNKPNSSRRTTVNAAIVDSKFPEVSTAAVSCKSLDCDRSTSPTCLQKRGKSNVSFIFPNVDHRALCDQPFSCGNSELSQDAEEVIKANFQSYEAAHKMVEQKPSCHKKTFFKKKKKTIKYKKGTTPFVYYAQTNNSSPFTKSDQTEDPLKCENELMSRSYLAQMINKQYKPKIIGDNLSTLSQFSSPVCRDVQPHVEGPCRCESDICSCCYGPFHNIDNHMNRLINPQTYMLNEINLANMYYDTKQYDMIPVKEKPVKLNTETARKKEQRPYFDVKCWPESIRSKYYQSLYPIPAINEYMPPPPADYVFKDKFDMHGKKVLTKINRTEPIVRVVKRRKEIYKRERPQSIETSKSCSVDFGNIYSKKNCKKPKKQEVRQTVLPTKKNAECLTTNIVTKICNTTECQTAMNIPETNPADAKTEQTLNQIKVILQSVLAEVKVTQTKNQVVRDKPKKDAVVQKGQSHNNMQGSSFMNSVNYSPYSTMHPSAYMATCSRHLNPSQLAGIMPNQFYYSHEGMKCFHNFPLFIPPPGGRTMYTNCYRNSSNIKSGYMKQAATIATNTEEVQEERAKETEKLIKEIYKSMALTMDVPNKESSLSEYDEIIKPIILKTEAKKQQPKKIKNVVQAVSELFIKKDMIDTSDTLNTTVESKVLSNEVTTQSQIVTTTDTSERMRDDSYDNYIPTTNTQPTDPELQRKVVHETLVQHSDTIETETSSTDYDIESTTQVNALAPIQKKEKQGLFSKMLKSVKLFKVKEKPKQMSERTESEVESTSDSDDYQTVYSQKIEKSVKNPSRPHNMPKRKTHSKISYKQIYQRDRSPEKKRSPYMEQEYRRYWDERLMFQDNRARRSSERMYSDLTKAHHAHYHTYEARSALIEPKSMNPKHEQKSNRVVNSDNKLKAASKGMPWLRKNKTGIHCGCGEQWKMLLKD
ncbi:uncharacterized protein LOC118267329 isoform X1 [Spodoptera frugiperda]|uniref:Uncharacterized protein LOC118267329 isoform X1 n=1 Tax=Spodoptera frugiperda TaxID=7108 RepID=A0A9R0D241_SPOFR|nr:uncharacterized protein LOC118267329 isoform X1 [Spodoptera frugiperda]